MSFGKSNQPQRRRRSKASEEEIDVEKEREEREDRMNSPLIVTVMSIIGVFMMLGVAVFSAPYTYGSQVVRYSKWHMVEGERVAQLSKSERDAADDSLKIDFTTVILPKRDQNSAALNIVAEKCRQGRSKELAYVPPHKAHSGYAKATRYLTCAMSTEISRLCDPSERQTLVEQLIEYKDRRQNVLAVEKYRKNAIIRHEQYRDLQRETGVTVPPPLTFPGKNLSPEMDPGFVAQLENIVRLGYFGPADFGYMGFYVPSEYKPHLTVGAVRYAQCS